jgi:hypothetical protein
MKKLMLLFMVMMSASMIQCSGSHRIPEEIEREPVPVLVLPTREEEAERIDTSGDVIPETKYGSKFAALGGVLGAGLGYGAGNAKLKNVALGTSVGVGVGVVGYRYYKNQKLKNDEENEYYHSRKQLYVYKMHQIDRKLRETMQQLETFIDGFLQRVNHFFYRSKILIENFDSLSNRISSFNIANIKNPSLNLKLTEQLKNIEIKKQKIITKRNFLDENYQKMVSDTELSINSDEDTVSLRFDKFKIQEEILEQMDQLLQEGTLLYQTALQSFDADVAEYSRTFKSFSSQVLGYFSQK